jgi:hypothetical protein
MVGEYFLTRRAFLLAILINCLCSYSQIKDSSKRITIPIKEAIEKNILELKIFGAYDPELFYEIIDQDGLHFGKCMGVILKSKTDSFILVKLECGTELIPTDSSYQTMIVTKTSEFPLYPKITYATRFYAMCGQIHDAPPSRSSLYEIGELSDSNTIKLAKYLDHNQIQNMIGQHALWSVTDNVESKELEKYGADSTTLSKTKDILYQLNIATRLAPKRTPPKKVEIKKEDNLITINRYYVYAGAGVIIVLSGATLFLISRRIKKDSAA